MISTAPEMRNLPALYPTKPPRLTFQRAARQGFGDRHNTWAWSMRWWKGKLYVGTNRAWLCCERASFNISLPTLIKNLPLTKYPPDDADCDCTPDPRDLPLQAEIWCWTPETNSWERVYQAPADAIVKGKPDKNIGREVGYRYMNLFTDPDGTEAMYIASVTPKFVFGLYGKGGHHFPPPGLLRTTDGRTFERVPQDAGTFMGDLPKNTLRTMVRYKNQLFLTHGPVRGYGFLIASPNPKAGNNSFRQVSPEGMKIFDITTYNGYLYVGVRDETGGYGVAKTDANGEPPYQFTTVVSHGGYLPQPSSNVISMRVFQNRLYVGTDRPAELIRINPDDSWDLIAGTPRETPDGWKYPLSGIDSGFGNYLNGHIWWMEEYAGRLYLGTMNMGMNLQTIPKAEEVLRPASGVHVFETADGCHFAPITLDGFGQRHNFGLRTMAATPEGFFLGTTNNHFGLEIWQGKVANEAANYSPPAEELEIEMMGSKPLLSWEATTDAKQYQIWRTTCHDRRDMIDRNRFLSPILKVVRRFLGPNRQLYMPPLPKQIWIPDGYVQIGTTTSNRFVDESAAADGRYIYYVVAEYEGGRSSVASNMVVAPLLRPSVGLGMVLESLKRLGGAGKAQKEMAEGQLKQAKLLIEGQQFEAALELLQQLYWALESAKGNENEDWKLADVQLLVRQLGRRVMLCGAGVVPAQNLS